jgi:hypothetical protein
MDFSFFTTDNKSGYKTNEKWFSKNHVDEYGDITNYCSPYDLSTFKEKIWFYYHKLTEVPNCSCGKKTKFSNRLDRGYNEFCSLSCFNSNKTEMVKRIKDTNQKKYGVDYYTQTEDFIKKQRNTKKDKYGDENYNNKNKMLSTKLSRYGNIGYNNIEKYKQTCIDLYGVDNYSKSEDFKSNLKLKIKEKYKDLEIIDISDDFTSLTINCDVCKTSYEITQNLLRERKKHNYTICTNCNPIGMSSSSYEDELCDILLGWGINIERHFKPFGGKKEIGIFLPNYNIGIEINGLYWHNELFVNKTYHLDKTLLCKDNGIDLIHIFEDEWLWKRGIVLSILKNKLNLITTKIFARKCIVVELTSKEVKEFLEKNHIQGNVNTTLKFGLIYNDELVSVMTFGKRNGIGNGEEWELIRFSNKINYNVIGGASKLFKYFLKKINPKIVKSYSDNRWFSGGLYKNLGFKYIHETKPNYWYVKNDMRYHRLNFKKNILINEGFDKNKTEKQIMFDRKIYRIYDCGNKLWLYEHNF